jgi:hypothetical protein
MSAKPSQPRRQGQPPTGGANLYNYRPPPQPVSQNRLLDALAERNLPPEEPESPPPTLQNAFFKGVFEFPFYLTSLGCLVGTSCGLSFSFFMLIFALDQGGQVGMTAIRTLGQSGFMAFILTMGFAMAHCRSILEETAYGGDAVQNWPGFDWKGWILTFFFVAAVLGEATALSYLLALPQLMGSPLPAVILTFVLFPVFLLSALENDNPFIPIAMPVLRSFKTVWWAWLLFYVMTAVLVAAWFVVALVGLATHPPGPYLSVFVSGPLFAVVMMIYARLLGRLTWCASQEDSDDDD